MSKKENIWKSYAAFGKPTLEQLEAARKSLSRFPKLNGNPSVEDILKALMNVDAIAETISILLAGDVSLKDSLMCVTLEDSICAISTILETLDNNN